MRSFGFFLKITVVLFVFTLVAGRVAAQSPKAEITPSNPYQLYTDLDKALSDRLPDFQQKLEMVIKDFNKGKAPETLQWIKDTIAKADTLIDKIRPDPNFDMIESNFDQIKTSLAQAERALEKKNYAAAKKALQKADVLAKVLLESPVLKMTQAQIDLDQAGRRITNKDYIAAGLFLDEALERIQNIKVENNPKLASRMESIKSQVVIMHQQTILGKYKEDKDSQSIIKQMRQAQVDSLSHYYDMWSNTYRPWDQ